MRLTDGECEILRDQERDAAEDGEELTEAQMAVIRAELERDLDAGRRPSWASEED